MNVVSQPLPQESSVEQVNSKPPTFLQLSEYTPESPNGRGKNRQGIGRQIS
jgi:hypothetical protein